MTKPLVFVWSGSPCRGVETFTASTADKLLEQGLDALARLMARGPRWVEISVRRGEREWFLSEQMPADFLQVAEWFDANRDRLFRRAGLLNRSPGLAR